MKKNWRYYEGNTSSGNILKDLSKVLTLSVKDDPITDDEGNIVRAARPIVNMNWDIVYPKESEEISFYDIDNKTPEEFEGKILNQISNIGDTVILKATTTKVDIQPTEDDLELDNDLNQDQLEMYLEIMKPKYLLDPEKFTPDTERNGIMPYLLTKDIYEKYASPTEVVSYKVATDKLNSGAKVYSDIVSKTFNVTCQNAAVPVGIGTSDTTKIMSSIPVPSVPGHYLSSALWYLFGTNEVFYATNLPRQFVHSTGVPPKESLTYTCPISQLYREDGTPKDAVAAVVNLFNDLKPNGWDNKALTKWSYLTVTVESSTYQYNDVENFKARIVLSKEITRYQLVKDSILTLEGENIEESTVQLIVNGTNQYGAFQYDPSSKTILVKYNITTVLNSATDGFDSNDCIIRYTRDKTSAMITERELMFNNHCVFVRMFDNIRDDLTGPKNDEIDPITGNVLKINSHVSTWSKLCWYQDFEEVLIDSMDTDSGMVDITQGKVYLPINTPGLNSDTKIKFWINTNNDRVTLMIMGNPSLDLVNDRHLISCAGFGRLKPFENSINDTAGNFMLYTSSSTTPCETKVKTLRSSTLVVDRDDWYIGYPTPPSEAVSKSILMEVGKFFDQGYVPVIKFGMNTEPLDQSLYTIIPSSNMASITIIFAEGVYPPANVKSYITYAQYEDIIEYEDGIIRDTYGNVLNVVYPDKWGVNTATGVIDISMFHTRSKAYFQRHELMFSTTQEYMSKNMYGKSAYTGEYYADEIKIVHGNDGPRGKLDAVLAIDNNSLVALDELVVNRNFSKDATKLEETYIFFPITAPFNIMAGSPNGRYGIALLKEIVKPEPTSDEEALQRAFEELYIGNTSSVIENLLLPTTSSVEGVTITWESSDETILSVIPPVGP